jgi:hypothetical protein
MEIALETAVKCIACGTCDLDHIDECDGETKCNYRIFDRFLCDVSEEDAKRHIDNAD